MCLLLLGVAAPPPPPPPPLCQHATGWVSLDPHYRPCWCRQQTENFIKNLLLIFYIHEYSHVRENHLFAYDHLHYMQNTCYTFCNDLNKEYKERWENENYFERQPGSHE